MKRTALLPPEHSATLTRRDVMKRLGCKYDSVLNYVRSQRLREYRVPPAKGHRSLPRYTPADVNAILANAYELRPSPARSSRAAHST